MKERGKPSAKAKLEMVHPARLELTTFYSGARKTPLRTIVLSSIEQSETSKKRYIGYNIGTSRYL